MAPRTAPTQRVSEQPSPAINEEAFQRELGRAVQDTEREIWNDALGDEELDLDGDDSLEQMGQGLEGTDDGEIEDDDEGEAPPQRTRAPQRAPQRERRPLRVDEVDSRYSEVPQEHTQEDWDDEEAGETEDDAPGERDEEREGEYEEERPELRRPRTREESEALRAIEERALRAEREAATLAGRVDELSRHVTARPQVQEPPPPKPDKWNDEEAYEQWMLEQAERRADARFEQRMATFRQEENQRQEQRVNFIFNQLAQSERGFEFREAYARLVSMDPKNPDHTRQVQGILYAPDPGAALFDWWETHGGPEFREDLLQQLLPEEDRPQRGERLPARGQPGRGGPPPRQNGGYAPRHEIRPASPMRRGPPSLNSVGGGGRGSAREDPELYDDSDEAVMRYAMR